MLCLQSEHRGLVQGARPIVSSGDRSASLFLHATNNLSHAALLLTKGGSVCNRRSDAEIETRIFLEYRPSSAITRDLPKFRMIFSHIGTPQISKKYIS